MRAKPILLLAGLAFFCGCGRPGPVLVPELSPPLLQEEVCSWEEGLACEVLFPCAGGIGWIDAANRIVVCDMETKKAAAVFTVPFPVTVQPFVQGDLLVLQDQALDRLLIYDLAERAVKFEAMHLGADHVLGVDADCLVYLEREHLAVNFWRRPGVVFRTPGGAAQFFNCQFTPERVLVLTPELLKTFWKKSGRFEEEHLPQPAISPFCFDGEHIYYGSNERYLVKYSTAKKRLSWKLKLGQALERQPFDFAGTLVASPGDQSVLQLSRRGTIVWWQALGSTLSYDLAPMGEHLAAVLLNRELRFIEPARRRTGSFKISGRPAGAPLAFRGSLYFMTRQGKTCRLQRVGSRVGVDIELEPAPIRWANRSMRFTLRFHNLPEPLWNCVIRDGTGEEVFSKSNAVPARGHGAAAGAFALAWVPLQAGDYTIRVSVRSQGREWQCEAPVKVMDPQQAVPRFYLHL